MVATPLVSVLITAYNRAAYIAEAITSVLNSTYQNIELIIVDDCSTDATYSIAQQFKEKDNRIKLYKNEPNLGQFNNRNKAISLASGVYIKFLDSDDTLHSMCITTMVAAMQSNKNAGIAVPKGNLSVASSLSPHDSVLLHYTYGNHLCFGPTATMFTKVALDTIEYFEPSYGILADTVLNIKIASHFDTVFVPNGLFFWRQHADQVTTEQQDNLRMIKERFQILNAVLSYNHLPLSSSEITSIKNNFNKIHFRHFLYYLFRFNWKASIQVKQSTQLSFRSIFLLLINGK